MLKFTHFAAARGIVLLILNQIRFAAETGGPESFVGQLVKENTEFNKYIEVLRCV